MSRRRGRKDYRDVDGVLILDKPVGCSSNQALQQVRNLYRASKAGHCGSLDPLATGVLPICLGEATKFSSYLLSANKTYQATCRLGETTTTGDAEGEVVERRPVHLDESLIRQQLAGFIGDIEQIPPMYSALKHQGKRLYELAREGKEVERQPRPVTIYSLELSGYSANSLSFAVSCSKGTYIRTLAEDIGAALGCGAHLTALRRSEVDSFNENDALTLAQLELMAQQGENRLDAQLLPVTRALDQFPELILSDTNSLEIAQGKRIHLQNSVSTGLYRLATENGRFMGLGEVIPTGELVAKRLMNTAR